MNVLRSCDGGFSGEHLIMELIIRLLKADGEFSVTDPAWIVAPPKKTGEAHPRFSSDLLVSALLEKQTERRAPTVFMARLFFSTPWAIENLSRQAHFGQR
jgi:hypothetical protein